VTDRLRTHLDDLLQTRRGVLVTATGVILLALVVRLLISGPRIPIEGRWAVLTAIALFAAGTFLSTQRVNLTWVLWLFPVALVTPIVAIASGTGEAQWLPLNLLLTSAASLAAVLVSTRSALAIAVAAPLALLALWNGRPESVVPLGIGVAGGLVAAMACLVAILTMTWAWQALTQRAIRLDARQEERVRLADEVIEQQERSLAWRTTALRIHESLLNSIRQVLAGGEVDRDVLEASLKPFTAPGYMWESNVSAPVATLFAQVSADLRDDPSLHFDSTSTDITLEPRVLQALRPALVEAARNAIYHGSASKVRFAVRRTDTVLVFTVDDNGVGIRDDAQPGLGSTEVLAKNIADIHGHLDRQLSQSGGISITITVPTVPTVSTRSAQAHSRFNAGRILITSPIAGAVVGGLLYMPFFAAQRDVKGVGIALLGILMCVLVGFVQIRWRPLRGLQAVMAIAPAVVLTVLASQLQPGCGDVNSLAAVVNTAGLAVVVLAAWSRWPIAILGLLAWGTGAILLYLSVPAGCGQTLHLAVINVLFVFPMMILGITVGARVLARTRAREEQILTLESRAMARVAATRDINGRLQASVNSAVALLQEIAQGAPVDTRRSRELECLDAHLRIEIQVDPNQAGGFAMLARHLGGICWQRGIPLEVRAVQSSADGRPVSDELVARLTALLLASGGRASLRAFTDGDEDHLSITAPFAAVSSAGLHSARSHVFADVNCWIEDGTGIEDRSTVMISRMIDHEAIPRQPMAFAASRRP